MKRKQRFFKLSGHCGVHPAGRGMLLCGAGFVGMGCDLDAFTYPRGGEPVAVSSFVEADAVDSIEIHASMGDVKIERASAVQSQKEWSCFGGKCVSGHRPARFAAGDAPGLLHRHGPGRVELVPGCSIFNSGRGNWGRDHPGCRKKRLQACLWRRDMGAVDLSDVEAGSVTVQGTWAT